MTRVEPVTDRVGEVASFFGGRARRDRVTGGDRCVGLPGQDLAEPPPIVQLPGEFDRLGEVRPCQLGVVGGGKAAGGQRPGQHGRVIDVARERQGLLRLIQAVGSAQDESSTALSASARARTAAATSASCATSWVRTASNQANPSRTRPRASHSGCSDDASVNASSVSEFSRLHANAARRLSISVSACSMTLLIITACRRVEQRRQRRVVIAVTRPHGVGFAGLAELFQRVLAHGFQQPVAGSAPAVVGHHQRLVDQQGELIEHLVALHLTGAGDRLGGVEVEAAQKRRQPAKQHPLGLGQQGVRPVHRGAQGLLAAHRGARTAGQQPEPVMQAVEDFGQRQGTHPRGGELDRQRQTVEARADFGHRLRRCRR